MIKLNKETVAAVYVSSWMFEEGTRYFVVAQTEDGSRWSHFWGVPSTKFSHTECEERAERMMCRIKAHLANGGSLDLNYWREDQPVYGSEAWVRFERGEVSQAADFLRSGGNPDAISDTISSYL